jgi:hypothetical protein
VIGEKNFPAKNGAGTVPPPQDGEYTVDDLVQIESALQEICNITAGIDSGDDGE